MSEILPANHHINCYFIERKAKDNKANKDYNNLGSKTFSMFRYGHVQKLSKRLPLM